MSDKLVIEGRFSMTSDGFPSRPILWLGDDNMGDLRERIRQWLYFHPQGEMFRITVEQVEEES